MSSEPSSSKLSDRHSYSRPYLMRTPSRRVMTSFENLVVLANYQEAMREARKMVWRDRGEPATELHTLYECLEHAGRGGIRAAILGFALRSGFNVFVLLFRIWKLPRKFRISLVLNAVLGQDSFRFATMLGTFAGLYKLILNSIPIIVPPPRRRYHHSPFSPTSPESQDEEDLVLPVTMKPTPSERRRGRLSFRAQTHELWVRKKTRRWHSVIAGAVAGGVGVLFEKRSRRIVIAQQLFVRGLQGSWNAFSERNHIRIPHGDVIVFSLACGQIMYAFLLRPDTIPPAYSSWILNASKVLPDTVRLNRSLVRDGAFDTDDIESIINRDITTYSNRATLLRRLAHAQTLKDFGPYFAPCEGVHPWLDQCRDVPLDRFLSVFRWMFPIYGALHVVPMILFKRKTFFEKPLRMLVKAMGGTVRSSAFLGVFVVIYQTLFCFKHNLYTYFSSPTSPLKLRKEYIDFFVSKQSFWLCGLLSGLSLFVEEKRRRGELAMYVLPKGLESAWIMAKGKGYVFRTGEFGEALLCAAGMGMVMSTYQNDPHHLSGLVRRILYQFIGPN